jgi:hypothetical protein
MKVMKTKNYMKRKILLTVFALALVGIFAWAQGYYGIYKNGAATEWIPSDQVDSVKVEDESVNFYKANSLVQTLAIADIDSLVAVDYDDDAIHLLGPAQDGTVDLNTVDSITFSWTLADGVENYTLKLGTQADLSDAKYIYLDKVSRKTFTADKMYDYLTLLDIDYALTDLYWTVEDIDGNAAAATPAKFKVRKRPKGYLEVLLGNEGVAFTTGQISKEETSVPARALVVDNDNNIFAVVREGATANQGVAVISEAKDSVSKLAGGTYMTTCAINRNTGDVYVQSSYAGYAVYRPANNYAMEWYSCTVPNGINAGNVCGAAYKDGYLYLKDATEVKMAKVNLADNTVSLIENSNPSHFYPNGMAMAFNPVKPNLLYYTFNLSVYSLDVSDPNASPVLVVTATSEEMQTPIHGICFDPKGNAYLANRNGSHAIWMLTSDGALIKVIGNGPGNVDGPQATAKMTHPASIGIGSNGCLYISQYGNVISSRIRKYTPHVPTEE